MGSELADARARPALGPPTAKRGVVERQLSERSRSISAQANNVWEHCARTPTEAGGWLSCSEWSPSILGWGLRFVFYGIVLVASFEGVLSLSEVSNAFTMK